MKKIYKTLLLVAGLVTMVSCSDFLDQTSPSDLDNSATFNNTYYTRLAVNKIYGSLTQDQSYSNFMPIIAGLNTDCELVDGLGSDAQNTSSERGNMNYNANPGWTQISRVWNVMYGIVENANLVIDGVNGSELIEEGRTERSEMLRYRAEAKTLRAMVYLDLIRLFGDIPFSTSASESDLGNVYIGKTDRDVIMDALIEDLEECIRYLPWAGEADYTTERITKGYAHGLLANVALTRAGWFIRESAKEGYITATENSDPTYSTQRCDDETRRNMYQLAEGHLVALINNNTHDINPSLTDYWNRVNLCQFDDSRENIFEIPMGLNQSGELGYTVGFRVNGGFPGGVSDEHNYGPRGNSSGKLKLTAPYYMSFDANDQRRDLTCALMQIRVRDGVYRENMLGNAPFAIYCGKWDYRKMKNRTDGWWNAVRASDQKVNSGINVVKLRYPYVLLMYAEVVNELYGGNAQASASGCSLTAFQALSKIHTRAFGGNRIAADAHLTSLISQNGLFSTIVDENAWELAGEGVRKFDLIRWNLLSSKIDEFKNTYRNAIDNAEWPERMWHKFKEDNFTIDVESFVFSDPGSSEYTRADFFGRESTRNPEDQTQLIVNLPSISSGLNREVRNRYLLPIASTTISTSNGRLHNSYGFTD